MTQEEKIWKKYEREIISFFLALYFLIPYFFINYFTLERVTHDFSMGLDQIVPFLPIFIFPYFTSYFIVFMPYFCITKQKYFRRIAWAYFVTLSLGYLIFLIYPVKMLRPEIASDGFIFQLMQMFYTLDHPYNSFPSLHVALSFLSAGACFQFHHKYWWTIPWATLIAVSTLLVKQHYVLDVIGGLLLFAAVYWLMLVRK